MILDCLPSKDAVNLRLASRAIEIPQFMFHRYLQEDLPWLWEAEDLSHNHIDWFQLYSSVKLSNLKGLRNRKRVWKDVEEIVTRMRPFRIIARFQFNWES